MSAMLASKPQLSYHMDKLKSRINTSKDGVNAPEDGLDEIVYNRMVDFVTKYQTFIDDSKVTFECDEGCISLNFPQDQIYIDFPSLSEISEENLDPIEIFKFGEGNVEGRMLTESEFSDMLRNDMGWFLL